MMHAAGYCLSVFIGLSLSLIGGGGSILTIPILVFFFDIDPVVATTYSLFIVGLVAISGSITHYRMHDIEYKTFFQFGIPSLIVLFIMRRWLLALIPQTIFQFHSWVFSKSLLVIIIFSVTMLLAGYSMISRKTYTSSEEKLSFRKLVILGSITGAITGFIGIGGGFIIVPSLVLFAGLPMKKAIGTSLVIITANCLVGILSNLDATGSLNYPFLLTFSAFAILGILAGTWAIRFIPDKKLKPVFGWIVLALSVVMILRVIMGY